MAFWLLAREVFRMRPVRRGGGSLIQLETMAAKLAAALVVASVLSKVFEASVGGWLVLIPEAVFENFALWQPVTYSVIENSPMGIIFGALIIYSIGGALEASWGSRRMLTFGLGTTIAAGVLTVALGAVIPAVRLTPFYGGAVLTSVFWVAYGLSIGRGQTNFWGIPISGNVLAAIGVGFVALQAVFGSWLRVAPDLFGIALTFVFVRAGSPRIWLLRYQSWRIQQRLKGRSRHLRVIGKERNTSQDSDRFLH